MSESNDEFDDRAVGNPMSVMPEQVLGWSDGEVDEFVESCDRLVRHLLDVGLRLQVLRAHSEPDEAEGQLVCVDDAELSDVLEGLDTVVRDASTAMLALATVLGGSLDEMARSGRRR